MSQEISPVNILHSLLNQWNVKNIISLDDDWKPTNKTLETIFSEKGEDDVRLIFDLIQSNKIDIDNEYLREKEKFEQIEIIEDLLNCLELDQYNQKLFELSSNDSSLLINILNNFYSNKSDFQSDDLSLKNLAVILMELQKKGINVTAVNTYSRKIFDSSDGASLWLLDRDLKGNNQQIFYILNEIIRKNDVALIITNDDSGISNRSQIADFVTNRNDDNIATNHLWVLKKGSIESGNYLELMVAIKNVLQGFSIQNITGIYKSIYTKAIDLADRKLRLIDPEDYDDYFNISFLEGSHVNDVVFRIRESLVNQYMNEILVKNDSNIVDNLLSSRRLLEGLKNKELENAMQSGDVEAAPSKENKFLNLKKDDKVVSIHSYEQWDYNINLLSYPIYTGDLFVRTVYTSKPKWSTTNDIYLLITQPCDSIIRKNNHNVSRGVSYATLIKGTLFQYDTQSYKKEVNSYPPNKLKVHFLKVGEKVGMVSFDIKNMVQIDFRILDLCSLDKEGISLISKTNVSRAKNMPSISWDYYNKTIYDFIEENSKPTKFEETIGSILSILQKSKVDQESSLSILEVELNQSKDDIIRDLNASQEYNNILLPPGIKRFGDEGFNIRRVARLNEIYALDIIKKSTDYISRQALPTHMF
ncbi:hypothetical protein FE784_22260 [Paenibacillus hemerocallicola]|uniref:Uncharacterized protein n=1 Tax=Paenibacillus hemerocallicola TaxID=1172614 RepID=A0A5C4T5J0_9BACL|nr:hypothetical protein [Paenibacillus hemerocallicola]TNJ64035.1 hypothetical protein FE784_22260 [Paenibacillus hemerocallicola]